MLARGPAPDWTAPWLAPLRSDGEAVWAQAMRHGSAASALNAVGGGRAPVRFVAGDAARPLPYECFIAQTRQVPTRDNLHDLFNGLVWLSQPGLKTCMNRLQAQAIQREGIGARRGRLRDALTLLDENGALLEAPAPLWQALRQRDWPRLFIGQRRLWAQARLTLVGHALLEKLVAPRKAMTAHVLTPEALAALQQGEDLPPRPFCPLPVLGVPGWWPDNQQPGFYDDASVFRHQVNAARSADAQPPRGG